MKSLKLMTVLAALSAMPAAAHNGEHSHGFVANIIHWLSSPTHSLFAVIGGVAVASLIFKYARKRA